MQQLQNDELINVQNNNYDSLTNQQIKDLLDKLNKTYSNFEDKKPIKPQPGISQVIPKTFPGIIL